MFRVTMKDGRYRWIAAAHVVDIGDGEPGMRSIGFDNGAHFTVRDTFEELVKQINAIVVVA
jgi:uncharacterized protein YlzI (FlbEa/FlbD family)